MNKYVIGIVLGAMVLAGLFVAGSLYFFPNQTSDLTDTGTTTPQGALPSDVQPITNQTPNTTGTTPAATTTPVTPVVNSSAKATLDPAAYTVSTTSPLIQGTAKGTEMVFVALADGSTNLWQSQVPVTNGKWMVLGSLPTSVTPGKIYSILIRANGQPTGDLIATGTIVYQP